jgi:hypothetical protein
MQLGCCARLGLLSASRLLAGNQQAAPGLCLAAVWRDVGGGRRQAGGRRWGDEAGCGAAFRIRRQRWNDAAGPPPCASSVSLLLRFGKAHHPVSVAVPWVALQGSASLQVGRCNC